MVAVLSLVVCALGLILFIINSKSPGNPIWAKVGEHMFWTGLLAFMLMGGGDQVVSLLKGG